MKKSNIDIEKLRKSAIQAIKEIKDATALESLRIRFLGRQDGELTKILRSLKDLALEEKRKIGPAANALRDELEKALENKVRELSASRSSLSTRLDLTMPGKKVSIGHLHPLTLVEKEIREIFKSLNFSVVEGPEVESEYYNFDALNIPKDHPARDMWDTFWLRSNQKQLTSDNKQLTKGQMSNVKGQGLLLRTHTSPVQIRYMEQHKPPFQIIVPGRVFRYEATDASHEINFHQVEGLMVGLKPSVTSGRFARPDLRSKSGLGADVTLANFKFVIQEFFRRLFKKQVAVRLRPSYFPFVEPGLEVDVQCVKCGGRGLIPQSGTADQAKPGLGCNICKQSGWLEVMGAGMVHPRVFEAAHYNPHDLQGFAFGLGLERIAMIKYNIPDIRLFYSGDLRFIKQF